MPEDTKEPAEHSDSGTTESTPRIDIAADDPGPIEIDVVMKNTNRYLGDLLAGYDVDDADADGGRDDTAR
jgi:hypothetical protein